MGPETYLIALALLCSTSNKSVNDIKNCQIQLARCVIIKKAEDISDSALLKCLAEEKIK